MKPLVVYRGRPITQADIDLIRSLIIAHPGEGRCALARRICRIWNWTQPNGILKDIICRGLLLQLESAGHLVLPPRQRSAEVTIRKRKRPDPVLIDTRPLGVPLREIAPAIRFHQQVRRTPYEQYFNSLIEQYHYLGYSQPVGEHLKYLIFAGERPIGCFVFSSAAFAMTVRDSFIGWSAEQRSRNRHLLAYNSRFLILPWVRIKFLASHLLAGCARRFSHDWQQLYQHPIHWLETFVDTERFAGTCYKAANWIYLGQTKGRGKYNKTHKQLTSIKAIYGLPLDSAFRNKLGQ